MMSSVMEGMEASDGIVARMDDAVYKCDSALAKKQREIHDEWEELVFDKIQRQIKRHVDGLDAEELSSSLQRDSETYTTTVREKQRAHPKAGVYLDAVLGTITIRSSPGGARSSTGSTRWTIRRNGTCTNRSRRRSRLDDWTAPRRRPSCPGDARVQMEQSRVHAPRSVHRRDGRSVAPGRGHPRLLQAGRGQVEQTQRGQPARRLRVSDRERTRETGIFRGVAGARRGRVDPVDRDARDMRDVVNQLADHSIDHAVGTRRGGDTWLEHRGRRYVDKSRPLPGADPDRRDLFGVMRYEGLGDGLPRGDKTDLAPRGDEWRAQRGIACFEELAVQKSNRKGLYHTLQQAGEVGTGHGQNAGDAWLDQKLKDPVHGKFASRWSGHRDGDLYGMLSHTHTYPPPPSTYRNSTRRIRCTSACRELNGAGDLKRKSRKHFAQYASDI